MKLEGVTKASCIFVKYELFWEAGAFNYEYNHNHLDLQLWNLRAFRRSQWVWQMMVQH